jgi:hypothetical protein
VGYGSARVSWIHVAHGTVHWRTVVDVVVDLRIPQKVRNFLTAERLLAFQGWVNFRIPTSVNDAYYLTISLTESNGNNVFSVVAPPSVSWLLSWRFLSIPDLSYDYMNSERCLLTGLAKLFWLVLYVCVCVYIHVCIDVYTHTYIHTYIEYPLHSLNVLPDFRRLLIGFFWIKNMDPIRSCFTQSAIFFPALQFS